ncbi:MAG TPA: HAD-IB family phosphatase [Thermoanaerobaculia bacterium]|nr:HAD-IB family phosphatase [Thermoanaerobaculia bacterium]
MTQAKYRNVFFDVDSTLVTIEGIDVLGRGDPAIAKLTEAAMNGEVPVDEVYGRRLDLIRPARSDVDALGRQYCTSIVDGAEEGLGRLREADVQIHLVTAGIAQAIEPLAARLKVARRAVHAVAVRFDDAGNYADFDRRSPLVRSGGKAAVVRDVRARAKGNAAFVGDGVTDLETKSTVDLFIGFGGVRVRQRVKENADVYVTDFRDVVSHLFA